MDPTDTTGVDPNAAAEPAAQSTAQTEEEAAFAAAFNDNEPDLQVPAAARTDEEKQADAQAPAEPKAADESAPTDPYADLPEPMRALLADIPIIKHQLSSAHGRLGALQRENNALKAKLNANPAPATAQEPGEPQESEAVKLVRDQGLPEVADAINDAVKNALKQAPVAPAQAPGADTGSTADDAHVDPELAREEAALNKLQPQWAEKFMSADFKLYLATQPEDYVSRVLTTTKAIDVLEALNGFDQHRAKQTSVEEQAQAVAAKRQNRAAAAVQPRGGAAPPASAELTEEQAFAQGFAEG